MDGGIGISGEQLLLVVLFGLVAAATVAEMYYSYRRGLQLYEKRDTLTNLGLMAAAAAVNLGMKAATFLLLDYGYRFRLFQIGNVWAYWIVLVLAQDLLYWCLHAAGHYVRLLWASHVSHHSSEYFNVSTGFRSTVFEPFYRVFFYLPLAFAGFRAVDIMLAYMVTQIYGNLVHTQRIAKLPAWIEYVFVTPSHHRVHHASNARYLDKNMGMVLILWDRWFGTFQQEDPRDPVRYGVAGKSQQGGLLDIVFREFLVMGNDVRKAPSFMDKLGYVFGPPGWSHDGRSKTAKAIRQELQEAERNGHAVLPGIEGTPLADPP